MALMSNIRLMLKRNVINEFRLTTRFYCDKPENTEDGDQDNPVDPSKDRTKIIPVETSIRYLNSKAYNTTYGDKPVWFLYRRNHKGGIAPRKTRLKCTRNGIISTGNPCPICRDEYLVLDPKNKQLLQQFISEHTGQVLDPFETGVCRKKHKELLVAIAQAYNEGYLTYDVPFRYYDYTLYRKNDESV